MESIKKALNTFLRTAGIERAVLQTKALLVWNEVVGEVVASNTFPEEVKHGTLVVRVKTPVWRNELSLRKREILHGINRALGKNVIKDIRLI
ncbi:MAG: DUF721 domain-containing protein [Fidelibacterota bacterium]